jgi:putative effector of murein hydrolase
VSAMASVDLLVVHPLFGLALTVGVYALATVVYERFRRPSMLHPVLTSVATIAAVLVFTGLRYPVYFAQASPLHNALSVFVVLLAVPLVRRLPLIRAARLPILAALLIGSVVAVATALAPPLGLGLDESVVASLAPKSATAAVAVGISERLGGIVGLAAMAAVLTGLFGAMVGPSVLNAAGVRDERAVGFAIGVAAHAIGTARAFQISETAGAFASLGMILNAVLTVALAPLAIGLLQ